MRHPERWQGGRQLVLGAAALGATGLLATVVGFGVETRRALFSYLFAWIYWGGLGVGALLLLTIFHASKARWPVVVRRMLETMAGALPLLAILFLPIAIGIATLFPWVRPEQLPERIQRHVRLTRPYLNVPFWIARSAAYLALWAIIGEWLLRLSRRQDEAPDLELTRRQRAISVLSLPWIGLALSFASLDWVMSTEPRFKSTIFGLYVFVGIFLSTFALLGVTSAAARGPALFGSWANETHRQAIGRFMFGFTAFWAYIAFDQYMLIWVANVPDEVAWYRVRTSGGWLFFAWLVVFAQFIIPTLALLSHRLKQSPRGLAAVGLWVLVAHAVDTYWLVLPAIDTAAPRLQWTDGTAFVAVGGLAVAFVAWRLQGRSTVPAGDPYLEESARYRHP